MSEFGRVILITGTPCVGKTSTSRLLAKKLNATHIDLADPVKREKLFSSVDKARKSLIADTEKVSKRVNEIIKNSGDKDIIVDGHYAVDVVPTEQVSLVFVLRRHPEELKRLMESRGFSSRKLWENLTAEILDISLVDAIEVCGREKICEIDVTGKSVKDAVEEMLAALESKKPKSVSVVDWLGRLESEGRLDDFLKNF